MSSPESTLPLDPGVVNTVRLYNRSYQEFSIENSTYCVPIDEAEQDRLNAEHRALQMAFDGRLIFPPIDNPTKILDCGYGSAAWAIEVAEAYPDSEVIGIDISPHMTPDESPPNMWLQVDDLNQPFTFEKDYFDIVQSRLVALGINHQRWNAYVRDCVRVLKPNGWLQMTEFYYNVQSDNGTLTETNALRQWSSKMLQAYEGRKDLRAPLKLERMFREAGLVDLETRMIPIPLNGWPRADREHDIGEHYVEVFKAGLSSLCLHPFLDTLNMSLAEVQVLIASARHELGDLKYRPYLGLYVCIGRKPSQG